MTKRDVIVIGAGVFGAWTALHLHRAGKRVTLVDALMARRAVQTLAAEMEADGVASTCMVGQIVEIADIRRL